MLQLILGCLFVALAVIISNHMSRRGLVNKEATRKSTHIVVALTFAFLPFFIGLKLVAFLAAFDILIAIVAKRYGWFDFLRSVGRQSWGEFFFLAGVIVSALLANSNWIFATGVLVMGLADAAAALVGRKHGKHPYKVLGQTKSLEGSLAFIVTAAILIYFISAVLPSDLAISIKVIVALSFATSLVEAAAPFGADNFIVPIFVILVLNSSLITR